jgi:alkyl hydroperoxide reductase subunit AhpC
MIIQLGATAPDFEAQTTEGPIRFHDWIGTSRAVPFSHSKEWRSPKPYLRIVPQQKASSLCR